MRRNVSQVKKKPFLLTPHIVRGSGDLGTFCLFDEPCRDVLGLDVSEL